jgi:hypothetical protein
LTITAAVEMASSGPTTTNLPPTVRDAFLIFFVVLVTHVATSTYKWYKSKDLYSEKYKLENEMKPLEKEITGLKNNTDHWVKVAKLQRKFNALETRLKQVNAKLGISTPQSGALGILDKVLKYASPKKWKQQVTSKIVQIVCGLFIVYYWWGVPLILFPDNWFWPFGFVFSKPWHPSGAIGALGWYIVCTRAVPRIIDSISGIFIWR